MVNLPAKVRLAILDDHQSIIDGYLYRLEDFPQVEIAGTAGFGAELEPLLAAHPADVVLLDINVPTDQSNPNPYPVLHIIPRLLETYPNMAIVVISMLADPALIKAVMEAGASGYILKDDGAAVRELGPIIVSVANGGVFLSQHAHKQLLKRQPEQTASTLTPRQLEILSLCAAYPNWTTAELASQLGVTNATGRNLLSGTYFRLGVNNRAAAIAKARQWGLISPLFPTTPR